MDLLARLQSELADRYTIERELGAGGMATVYLARDLRHERAVALKVLRPELSVALGAERFLREIRTTAQLTHPNILPVHDSGEADGTLYYVMPYVEGESLRDRLTREKQLPLEDALQITREVADALSYAHSHGIVHRDIKPENILLEGGHAVVADFGIARAVTSAGGAKLTETGLAIGTPVYMSPEQAAGSKEVDGRSDLYSLGCVLYEMLAGDAPYTASTPQAVIAKKLSEPLPRISVVREAVPEGIEAALNKAMARTPADRFPTASDFAAALAHPETVSGVLAARRVWWRRRAVRVGAAVSVVTVLAIVAAVVAIRGRGPALDPKVVVVAPFQNQIRDTSLAQLGAIASDWVGQTLQGTGEIKVVPTVEVTATGWAPGSKVHGLALATGAGTVITGIASLQGDSVYLRADVLDGRSGELLSSLPPVAAGRGQPLDAVKEMARRASGATAEILFPTMLSYSHDVHAPASYEAYREFAEGVRSEEAGQLVRAWGQFERAYALDTSFLRALIEAALAHADAGDYPKADSTLKYVERRRDRLTRIEQLKVQSFMAEYAGDYSRAILADRELAQLEPSGASTFNWGYHAVEANRPAEAVHALVDVAGDYALGRRWEPHWWLLAAAYHLLGRHADELRVAQRGRQLFPKGLMAVSAELRALAALGREKQAARLLVEARAMEPDGFLAAEVWQGAGPWQPYEAALEFRAHGHGDAYRRAIQQTLESIRATAPIDTAAIPWRWGRAVALYAAEQWAEARAVYAVLKAADSTNVDFLGGLAASEARLGHRVEASVLAARLSVTKPPYSFGRSPYWRARIAALLGDRDGAVARLREALAQGMVCTADAPPWADCHRDIDFESLRGYAPFDELLRPKG